MDGLDFQQHARDGFGDYRAVRKSVGKHRFCPSFSAPSR
jgi:hypothetical protein